MEWAWKVNKCGISHKEEKSMLENPPEIVKSTINYLVLSQMNWEMKEINHQENKMHGNISKKIMVEDFSWWKFFFLKDIEDTNLLYILEKITEENRQINFIENDDYINTARTIEKGLKWKEVSTPDTLNISSVQIHSNSTTQAIKQLTIEDMNEILEELEINNPSDLLRQIRTENIQL